MHIVVVGVAHTTAPIALRERLACSLHQIPQILRITSQVAQECVLLSTCNRFELYAVLPEISAGKAQLLTILSAARQVSLTELEAHSYCYAGEEAIAHLFGVTCGLYSLVPGEPQIQGQVVEALEIAQGAGYAGSILSALFRAALVTGKRARNETSISRNAASVSHVAVQLARQVFPELNNASILLIGSGKMSELAVRNLCDNGAQRLVIINRTSDHALDLAQRYGAVHRNFSQLSPALIEADVVISSTGSPRAIITPELMQQVVPQRHGRKLLLIDIALPRDIDPSVAPMQDIYLYNLDDLQEAVSEGIRLRQQEIQHVQTIIAEETSEFERWLRSLAVVDTISDLRNYVEVLRQQELARTMRQLAPTLSKREAAAVQEFSNRLVNKLLHTPMLRLKEAAADGQGHTYSEVLRYLFGLEEYTHEADKTNNHRDARQQTGHDTDEPGSRAAAAALARPGDNYRTNSHDGRP